MKPLVIYHASCADGFGAAFAAWTKLGDEAEYVAVQYGTKEDALRVTEGIEARDVYVLDFSFPKDVMDYLFAHAKRVVWLDHHKTAFEMWCGEYEKGMRHVGLTEPHEICLDDNCSGALIAWQYFHGTEAPMLIKHIDDYDRWQFKLEGTKAFSKALWSYAPWSFEQWEGFRFSWDNETWRNQFEAEGRAILRAHSQNVQSVVKHAATECVISTGPLLPHMFDGLAANCPPHFSSDVGHELANQSDTFGLLWHMDKAGKVKCSLRSNSDYDVSAIAKAFGGGGHKNAAGFETDSNTLMGWLK